MKTTRINGVAQDYVARLSGPRTEAGEELEMALQVPAPSKAAKEVSKHLHTFAKAIEASTNATFNGAMVMANGDGFRDGIHAIPGRAVTSCDQAGYVRPPAVERLVQLGVAAMTTARANADLCRAKSELDRSVASTSADVALGKRRRRLHRYQSGLLVLLSGLAISGFGAIAARLNDWPSTPGSGDGGSDGATATSSGYLMAATAMIVAIGITVGFFRATQERWRAVAERDGHHDEVARGDERARRDRLVSWSFMVGLASSVIIAGLLGIGGYFQLETVSAGRMVLGVVAWLLWGAAAYGVCVLMAQLCQHWLNLKPAEMDLTDYDKASGAQNTASAIVGRRYLDEVLASQHQFAVDAGIAIIDRYYEANLLARISSRDEALDAFIRDDVAAARAELQAKADALRLQPIGEPTP
jgi:hypothetical protein